MSRLGALSIVAALGLCACSGGAATPEQDLLPQSAGSNLTTSTLSLQPAGNCIKQPLRFVSDDGKGLVYVYNHGSSTVCLVIHLVDPFGIDVDSAGTLYVASPTLHKIVVYKPPYTAVSKTIIDGTRSPLDVALCPHYIAATNNGTNTVTIFSYAGATLRILTAAANVNQMYVTCDPAGNLYTNGDFFGVTSFSEFKGGKGSATTLAAINAKVTGAGGLEWEQGALWVDDPVGLNISSWPPPFTSVGSVISLSGAADPIKFEISSSDSKILSADLGLDKAVFYDFSGVPVSFLKPFVSGGALIGASYSQDDSP